MFDRYRTLAFCVAAAAAAILASAVVRAQTPSVELAPGISFEVVELKRLPDQGVLQLKFAVTNKSGQDTRLIDHGVAYQMALEKIDLIDPAGRKTYHIGRSGRCLCTTFTDGGSVKDGQRREFWAWYAMPPSSVQRMTIQLASVPPITNVPLQ
jgi:hypothetical protein